MFVYGATNFGANAFVFSRAAARSGAQWVDSGNTTASLVLWVCVVTTGRWMAYI